MNWKIERINRDVSLTLSGDINHAELHVPRMGRWTADHKLQIEDSSWHIRGGSCASTITGFNLDSGNQNELHQLPGGPLTLLRGDSFRLNLNLNEN